MAKLRLVSRSLRAFRIGYDVGAERSAFKGMAGSESCAAAVAVVPVIAKCSYSSLMVIPGLLKGRLGWQRCWRNSSKSSPLLFM